MIESHLTPVSPDGTQTTKAAPATTGAQAHNYRPVTISLANADGTPSQHTVLVDGAGTPFVPSSLWPQGISTRSPWPPNDEVLWNAYRQGVCILTYNEVDYLPLSLLEQEYGDEESNEADQSWKNFWERVRETEGFPPEGYLAQVWQRVREQVEMAAPASRQEAVSKDWEAMSLAERYSECDRLDGTDLVAEAAELEAKEERAVAAEAKAKRKAQAEAERTACADCWPGAKGFAARIVPDTVKPALGEITAKQSTLINKCLQEYVRLAGAAPFDYVRRLYTMSEAELLREAECPTGAGTTSSVADSARATTASGDDDNVTKLYAEILATLGIDVLGEDASRDPVIFSRRLGKTTTIKLAGFRLAQLMQHVGRHVERHVVETYSGGTEWLMPEVIKAIAAAAGETSLEATPPLGQGVWLADGKLVIVDGNVAAVVEDGKMVDVTTPKIGKRVLSFGTAPAWCDLGKLKDYLAGADAAWSRGVVEELIGFIGKWRWTHTQDAAVLAGAMLATWVQSCWSWRPHIGIKGESGDGKSMFLERVRDTYGELAIKSEDATEAGIRQRVRTNATILVLDEFDKSTHREAILSLLRTASAGSTQLRGTVDQQGREFGLRQIAWVGGLHLGLTEQADQNRFIVLTVRGYPPDCARGTDLGDLGLRALAVALRSLPRALEIAKSVSGTVVNLVPARLVSNMAIPASMLAAALGEDSDQAKARLLKMIEGRGLHEQVETDKETLLSSIFTATVHCGARGHESIGRLLVQGDLEELEKHGLGVIDHLNQKWLFVTRKVKALLPDQRQQVEIDTILLGLSGAARGRHCLGSFQFRGVRIPMNTIHALFGFGTPGQPTPQQIGDELDTY